MTNRFLVYASLAALLTVGCKEDLSCDDITGPGSTIDERGTCHEAGEAGADTSTPLAAPDAGRMLSDWNLDGSVSAKMDGTVLGAATAADASAAADALANCVATAEECDGRDNDCDGVVDNGAKNACGGCVVIDAAHAVGVACSNGGKGACDLPGSYACSGSTTVCSAPSTTPSAEVCDGRDNDCDGVVDNGVMNACGGCGALAHAKDSACDNGLKGECAAAGVNACTGTNDAVACTAPSKASTAEVCDSKDNDCNGVVDDAPGVGLSCSAGVGECASAGSYVCSAAGPVCNAVPKAKSYDVCDGLDNDCDGNVDNGSLNECNGCGAVQNKFGSMGKGNNCVYFWNNSQSECSTLGVGACDGPNSTYCMAVGPKPACAE